MAIITARGFGYRHASRKNPVFSDLDFTVDRGEKLLLLGASGSGKSTLLAAIAGVLGSDDGDFSGELTVSGVVGMVLQDPDSQVIASRVGDDVAFGCENLGFPGRKHGAGCAVVWSWWGWICRWIIRPRNYPGARSSG